MHGRDSHRKEALDQLLRSYGVTPIEWGEATKLTRSATPSVLDIVEAGISVLPQAVVVLLTPDDIGYVKRQFRAPDDPPHEVEPTGQPRLNVIFEAGYALSLFRDQTILVELGNLRRLSDLAGLHTIRIGTGSWRAELRRRLQTAGCRVVEGDAWQTAGQFDEPVEMRYRVWEAERRSFKHLLDSDELRREMRSVESRDSTLMAYVLASAVQHNESVPFWLERSRSNDAAAMLLVEIILTAPVDHIRPRFRAAKCLELMDSPTRERALAGLHQVRKPEDLDDLHRQLLEAARSGAVTAFTQQTPALNNERRSALLGEFGGYPPTALRLMPPK